MIGGESTAGFDYSLVDKVVKLISERMDPDLIIIFGSVASRTARQDSDIDMIVVMETDAPYYWRNVPIHRLLRDSGIRVDRDIIVLTPAEFKERLEDRTSFVHDVCSKGYVAYEA